MMMNKPKTNNNKIISTSNILIDMLIERQYAARVYLLRDRPIENAKIKQNDELLVTIIHHFYFVKKSKTQKKSNKVITTVKKTSLFSYITCQSLHKFEFHTVQSKYNIVHLIISKCIQNHVQFFLHMPPLLIIKQQNYAFGHTFFFSDIFNSMSCRLEITWPLENDP